ncbi:MAG: Spy/CpxP family protein refolding chaperone [Bacteroidetes bacterium]|nr:Spy/CpxP family protein refolding chaperone [Bacteroidota bacterium]MCH8326725.1 Spy/CpxP family protein refolding chaperone [Bacteroidota bacterium]
MKIKKNSVISAVIITLLVSSLSLAQHPEKRFSPNDTGMHKMHDKLNLTDIQKDKFQKMKFSFEKQMIDLKANLQKSVLDMKVIRASDNIKRDDVINVVKKINGNKNAIALASANHRMDMYEILTPEQRKVWKKSKMHKMAGKKIMKMKKMMKQKMHRAN